MMQVDDKEKLDISRGHMPTLQRVIKRELEARQERLVHEQNAVSTLQGQAQILLALLKLID